VVVKDEEDHAGKYRWRKGGFPSTADPSDFHMETPLLVLERLCPHQSLFRLHLRRELEITRFGISGIWC